MLSKRQIADIVKAAVGAVLPGAKISDVKVDEDVDSLDERPTLAIMVVFTKRPSLKGQDFFMLGDAIRSRLIDAGEMRYPFMRYVGEKEFRGAVS